jgi:hypothetical protein
MLNDWAYGPIFANSAERTAALKPWLTYHNFTRPHGSLSHNPPASRLINVTSNYIPVGVEAFVTPQPPREAGHVNRPSGLRTVWARAPGTLSGIRRG